MKLLINKTQLVGVIKQVMKEKQENKIIKQIRYHQSILNDPKSDRIKKKSSFYRLKQIRKKFPVEQKDVMPNVGDAGHQLRKQGGLAKAILPFKGPKRITQKRWQKKHLRKNG